MSTNLTITVKLNERAQDSTQILETLSRTDAEPGSEQYKEAIEAFEQLRSVIHSTFNDSLAAFKRTRTPGNLRQMSMRVTSGSFIRFARTYAGWEFYDSEYRNDNSIAHYYFTYKGQSSQS